MNTSLACPFNRGRIQASFYHRTLIRKQIFLLPEGCSISIGNDSGIYPCPIKSVCDAHIAVQGAKA